MPSLDDVLDRVREPRQNGDGYTAFCPAHPDGEKHKRRSLSIHEKGGKVLVHCFAGCSYHAILDALGLGQADTPTVPRKEIIASYPYKDRDGQLLAEAVRYLPKSFAIRRPDGQGDWIWNAKGLPALLYRLPEMLRAVEKGQAVLCCEGEKSCDAAAKLGFVAVTNAFGSGKWTKGHAAYFPVEATVAVLADNDDPGREHAQIVAKTLRQRGCTVRLVTLPDLPPKGDIVDWVAAGGNREALLDLIDAEEPEPEPEPDVCHRAMRAATSKAIAPADGPHLTDLGNADRLVAAYGNEIRFTASRGWLAWDGKRWREDGAGVLRRAQAVARALWADLDNYDGAERDARYKWAKASENAARLRAMVDVASVNAAVHVLDSVFDADPFLFNCVNGTLNLRTGKLRPHAKDDLITRISPVAYDPDAKCPRFEKFLREVFDNHDGVVGFMQRFFGHSLTGDTRERKMALLHGIGRNGKTRLLEALRPALGEYAATASADTILEKKAGGNIPNDIARLRGVRLVVVSETPESGRLKAERLKGMIGGDSLCARFLNREFFEFLPEFKLVVATNFRPVCSGADQALFDRIRLVPFNVRFDRPAKGEAVSGVIYLAPDDSIGEKLAAEAAGILAWAVRGCLAWQRDGLQEPPEVLAATRGYQDEADSVGRFIADACVLGEGLEAGKSELREAYETWADREGEKPVGGRRLAEALRRRGVVDGRDRTRRFWAGIALADDGPRDTVTSRDTISGVLPMLSTLVERPRKSCHEMSRVTECHFSPKNASGDGIVEASTGQKPAKSAANAYQNGRDSGCLEPPRGDEDAIWAWARDLRPPAHDRWTKAWRAALAERRADGRAVFRAAELYADEKWDGG